MMWKQGDLMQTHDGHYRHFCNGEWTDGMGCSRCPPIDAKKAFFEYREKFKGSKPEGPRTPLQKRMQSSGRAKR